MEAALADLLAVEHIARNVRVVNGKERRLLLAGGTCQTRIHATLGEALGAVARAIHALKATAIVMAPTGLTLGNGHVLLDLGHFELFGVLHTTQKDGQITDPF